MVSQIIMKLLAKTAEDRYQSAAGLRNDLEQCAEQWTRVRTIAPFGLARRDVSERFAVADRLYGREPDLAALLAAFDRCSRAGPGITFVAGFAGVGKSALINALQQPVAQQRGHFISGKFDQRSRGIPYQALVQAFQMLVQQLLTEPPERLQRWRDRILDDLQLADAGTLSLLEPLLTSSDILSLFVIGAYRLNQVDEGHPLRQTVQALEKAGARIQQISLTPLKRDEIAQLVADTMKCPMADALDLAQAVLAKTAGNPFFAIQFLKTLHQDGLITFDVERLRWVAGVDAIRSASITENVVDLMSRRIDRLGQAARNAITYAACIGNRFDLTTLATVTEQSSEATELQIAEAIAAGLIIPEGQNQFVFLHDRVQQAAYARTPDVRKPEAHLAAGRLLLQNTPASQIEDEPFDVASHLNIGAHLITAPKEQRAVAHLNLLAGRKARLSSAYQAALEYFAAGVRLIDEAHWRSDYPLAFSINLEAAQCEVLCGDFNGAQTHLASLLGRARDSLDKAKVYSLQMVHYENAARYADALATAREALALFEVSFPDSSEAKQAALDNEIDAIGSLIGERSIQSLVDPSR